MRATPNRVRMDRSVSQGLRCALAALSLALLGAELCTAGPRPSETEAAAPVSKGSRGGIDELHLFTVPVALNLDREPGPDGFEIKVYASSAERAKGVPITKGSLEVVMYDGVVSAGGLEAAKPLHTWTYTAAQLKPFASTSSLGVGYRMAIRWAKDSPKGASITVVVRHLLPKRETIYSSPSVIAVEAR